MQRQACQVNLSNSDSHPEHAGRYHAYVHPRADFYPSSIAVITKGNISMESGSLDSNKVG